MQIQEIEHEIVLGVRKGETPADLLYMCHSVAASRMAHRQDFDTREHWYRYEKWPRHEIAMSWRARLLYGAGLVLCPVFEPVKHENYGEYTERMEDTRLQYAGIATDPKAKFDFANRIEHANEKGAFQSLDAAAGMQLWSILRRSGESEGGRFA